MKKSLGLQIALLAVALPISANAASLCGREYENTKSLIAQLRSDDNVKGFPERKSMSVYFDGKALTLWWARKTRSGISIITCKQKVASANGFLDGGVQADCNQDRSGVCVDQARAMSRAKF